MCSQHASNVQSSCCTSYNAGWSGMRNKPLLVYLVLINALLILAVCLVLNSRVKSLPPRMVRTRVMEAFVYEPPPNTTKRSEVTIPGTTLLSHFRDCLEFSPGEYERCPAKINVIIVISAPSNRAARNIIRATWGQDARKAGIWVRFLVGEPGEDSQLLDSEGKEFGDVIRCHCVDSYRNLTLKTVSLVSWLAHFCSNGGFVLKTDDDVFVNVVNLERFASSCLEPNSVVGRLAQAWKPHRNPKNKYFIPRDEFEGDVYPDFVTGPGYLFQADLSPAFYNASLGTTFLRLEDVFLTGVVAGRLGVRRRSSPDFRSDSKWAARHLELKKIRRAITIHKNTPQRMQWLFKATRSINTS